MARRKTVVFDFDGVINSYKSGFVRPTVIPDPPVDGIKDVIENVRKEMRVVVVSSRCSHAGGIEAIQKYLDKYEIVVDKIQMEKPPAAVYVDDRAVCFDGNTDGLVEKIIGFKNWIELKQ